MFSTLKNIYEYREMIFSLVRKDLRGRYKGSVLGFCWTFINPLLQLLVYNVVFSVILKNNIDIKEIPINKAANILTYIIDFDLFLLSLIIILLLILLPIGLFN